jgi:hypothetical protein
VSRFCVNGHDTQLSGRYANYSCKACSKARARGVQRDRPARFCKNGHDTEIDGRLSNGCCRVCTRYYSRTYDMRRRYRGTLASMRLRRIAYNVDNATAAWMVYRQISWESSRERARELFRFDRLSIDAADRWCIALGTHLAIVFPELYASEVVVLDEPEEASA